MIVGVLSDEACVKFDRFPTTQIEDRIEMFERLPQVNKVVIQKTTSYKDVLNELKPDYVIHGDNWKSGAQSVIRQETIEMLKEWNGQLIEIPYTRNINVKKVDDITREKLAMPEYRRKRLRQLLKLRPIVKAIEVHNGITGLIAEKTVVERNGELDQFDTMWISSLCDSTAKGKPDIELVDMSSRLDTVNDVMEVTTKPIVLDGDTGGLVEHFVYNVRTLKEWVFLQLLLKTKLALRKIHYLEQRFSRLRILLKTSAIKLVKQKSLLELMNS